MIKTPEIVEELDVESGILAVLSVGFLKNYTLEDIGGLRFPFGSVIALPEGLYRVDIKRIGEKVTGLIKVGPKEGVFIGDPIHALSMTSWPDFLDDTESDADLWHSRWGVVLNTRNRHPLKVTVSFLAICEADIQPPEWRS